MTLNEAKEIVAKKRGYKEWNDAQDWLSKRAVDMMGEAAELYAKSLQADAWERGFNEGRYYGASTNSIFGFDEPVNPYKP